MKNRFETGNRVELVTPAGNYAFTLETMLGRDGTSADVAPGSGHVVKISIPDTVEAESVNEYALLVRHFPRTGGGSTAA